MERSPSVLSEPDSSTVQEEFRKMQLIQLLNNLVFLLSISPQQYLDMLYDQANEALQPFFSAEQQEEISTKHNSLKDRLEAYIDLLLESE